jgi:enoyl-CoA hydratase
MTDTVLVSRPSEKVALVTLNRPDQLNAVNVDLVGALHAAFDELAVDRTCRAIVLTGAGRAFCAGLDLTGFGEPPHSEGLSERRTGMAVQTWLSRLILKLRDTPQPVISAVNGPAAGMGLALSLASDLRYADPSAVFRAAFMNMGLSNCDMSTSWLLPRLVGASKAHEMMLTMRKVGAEEAERIGLVASVSEAGGVVEQAVATGEEIAALSPWGVRLTKQGMWSSLEMPQRAAVEYEDRQQILASDPATLREAIGSFLEKRPADFPD